MIHYEDAPLGSIKGGTFGPPEVHRKMVAALLGKALKQLSLPPSTVYNRVPARGPPEMKFTVLSVM